MMNAAVSINASRKFFKQFGPGGFLIKRVYSSTAKLSCIKAD